jgi:hypothetical protein
MRDKELWVIILIVSSLVLRELWILFPADYTAYKMFPYSEIEITKQTYWSYPLRFASEMMWTAAIYLFIQKFRFFFHVLFVVQFIEIIEYFYTYNEPWFEAFGIPVGITVTKFIVLTLTIIMQWYYIYYKRQ